MVTSTQGREAVVAILKSGDFLGEGCLIGQPLRLATAKAVTRSEVMRVRKEEMIRVLHAEPAFSELFMAHLLTRNSRVEDWTSSTRRLFNSERKAPGPGHFFSLTSFGKEHAPQPIGPKIRSGDAGRNRRARPGRAVNLPSWNKFRKLGFVDYNGDLKVHSALLSVVLHG